MTDTHPTAPHNATDDPANGPTGDPATLLVSLAEATAAFDDAIVDDESRLAAADRLRDAAAAVLATTTVRVRTVYAGRVAGVDADNDVVVPLGEPDKPIYPEATGR